MVGEYGGGLPSRLTEDGRHSCKFTIIAEKYWPDLYVLEKTDTPVRYIFLTITLFISVLSGAQITAPGMRSVKNTFYPSAPAVKDPVFFFCRATGSEKASLTASSPSGTGPFNFSWYKWNDVTKSFSDLFLNASGLTSTATGLDEGGYRVSITGSHDTVFTAWVVFDVPPRSSAALKQQLCYRVALDGDTGTTLHRFYYRDPANGSYLSFKNQLTFMWSSQPMTFIPGPDFNVDPVIENRPDQPNRTYQLPVGNTTFKLTVNSLGCQSESSFQYVPIHVKADFSADPLDGDAPLEVTFTDKSIRANNRYVWDFGEKNPDGSKKTWEVNKDSLFIFQAPFTHTYYRPGEYTVKLFVESDKFCVDTLTLEKKIKVEPSALDIPNVFTPNGDSQNDYFLVESKSLRWLSVEIFSRSGLLVYKFIGAGDSLSGWKGWDGNVNESSAKASPGVYYYIIKAQGWDDVKYDGKAQRGFVYLYR